MIKHRIVLTGGGTGGHIYPALAVAEVLKSDFQVESLLYIGAAGHMEEKLAAQRQLEFAGLEVSGMPRKLSMQMLKWPVQLSTAVARARYLLRSYKPTVILGTGGYASAPPLMAAFLSGVPYAIHEPDAHPGLVNRLLSAKARLVSCGMEGAVDALKSQCGKVVVNGNPVRQSFVSLLRRDAACAVLGLNPQLKTLLITGGSQGAKALNDAVFAALPALLEAQPELQIIHQVGEKNLAEYKQRLPESLPGRDRYFLRDYFDDLSIAYAVSDLAICRSGAMTIAELTVTGTPAIFVPYPFAAADHQMHNAQSMQNRGAAVVMPQDQLTAEGLTKEALAILQNDERLQSMRAAMFNMAKPQAANDLANQLKELSTEFQVRQTRKDVAV
jgi:UDP-N-acetylglucosamine--N-acetylmuramyl-(pentapeptide) pyrophosphoryl-undecaprenol N-acetylglucosamine transferase